VTDNKIPRKRAVNEGRGAPVQNDAKAVSEEVECAAYGSGGVGCAAPDSQKKRKLKSGGPGFGKRGGRGGTGHRVFKYRPG